MQNTKTTIIVTLFLAFFCLSSCTTNSIRENTTLDKEEELLTQLMLYNDNLISSVSSETKSPNWKNIAKVAVADIGGAGTGAKVGGKIGAKIGAFLGSPIYGAATGALVGGVAFGAFLSYLEYDDGGSSVNRTNANFEMLYNSTIEAATLMMLVRRDTCGLSNLTFSLTDSTYIATSQLIPSDQIDFPEEYEEIELVGVGHNLALEAAMESMELIDTTQLSVLTDLEADILSSQELKSLLSDVYWGIEIDDEDFVSISDAVIDTFLEAYSIISEEDVLDVANDYVEIISTSHALTIDEERAVYSALSVAVNTTFYWSSHLR